MPSRSGKKCLEDAAVFDLLHRRSFGVPSIEFSDYGYGCRVRRPYGKIYARLPVDYDRVRAKFIIYLVVGSFPEEISVHLGNLCPFFHN